MACQAYISCIRASKNVQVPEITSGVADPKDNKYVSTLLVCGSLSVYLLYFLSFFGRPQSKKGLPVKTSKPPSKARGKKANSVNRNSSQGKRSGSPFY